MLVYNLQCELLNVLDALHVYNTSLHSVVLISQNYPFPLNYLFNYPLLLSHNRIFLINLTMPIIQQLSVGVAGIPFQNGIIASIIADSVCTCDSDA